MSDTFWTIVLGSGAVQGVFLGSVLLIRRNGNRRLGALFSALLVIFALAIFAQVLQEVSTPRLALFIAFLNINTELTVGPVYYLIMRSLVFPRRPLRKTDFMHFIPFLLGLAFWGSAWFGVDDHQRLMRFGFDTAYPVLEFLVFKAVILYSYFIASCHLLVRESRRCQLFHTGRHRVDPKTLLRITMGLACIPTTIYVIAALEHLGLFSDLHSDRIGSLLLVGTIFSAAGLLMFRPWVFSLKPGDAKSREWKRDATNLAAYFEQEKPWLDPGLRVADVAGSLNWTESHLSGVIREGMNATFNELLNDYRLAEFERLARDVHSRSRVILELAFEAGFGSKAAFYRTFKEAHDTTPTRYCNLVTRPAPK